METHPPGWFGQPPDAVLLAAASRGDWVLTTAELLALGISERQIAHRVRTGLLHRRHHGVYAVGRPQLSFHGACRAALLACGPGSAISHWSAARFSRFARSSGPIHVSVPRGRKRQRGIRLHQPRSLKAEDVVEIDGIVVTTVARTLLDLAAELRFERVAWLMHEAAVQRVLDHREVWVVLERHQHHRGRGKLEAALSVEVAPTRSGLEQEMLEICSRAGVPQPVVNQYVWSTDRLEEVDFHWPTAGLVIEADGGRYHSTRWRRLKDAEKTARLRSARWVAERIPEAAVVLDPDGVGAEVARLHASAVETHRERGFPRPPA